MTDYQKKLADSISIEWKVAHESENQEAWYRRWMDIHNQLGGIQGWLIWGDDSKAYNELKEDLRLLKEMAWQNAFSKM